MIAGRRFHFRPVLTICAGVSLAVLVALGNWQLQRLEWKRALIAKIETRIAAAPAPLDNILKRAATGEDMEYAPVRVSGVYAARGEAKVFGAIEGTPGYFLFTPLMRRNAPPGHEAAVYINRGFVPQTVDGGKNGAREISNVVEAIGLFRRSEQPSPPASWFRSTEKGGDGFWFVRDPERFAADENLPVGAYYIDSFAVDGEPWPKGGTTRLDFRNKHMDYALTWFGLAGALIAVWFAMSLQPRE